MSDSHDLKPAAGKATISEQVSVSAAEQDASTVSRRSFLRWSALAEAGATLASGGDAPAVHGRRIEAVHPMRRRPLFRKTFGHSGSQAVRRSSMSQERAQRLRRRLICTAAGLAGLPRPAYL